MIKFKHVNATTIDEAVSTLGEGKAAVIAGGTDLIGMLRGFVSPNVEPEILVNIKTIPDLSYINEESGMLKIGALTTLSEIAKSSIVKDNYAALAEAAGKVGAPELRNMGTIGGNICQQIRCWYYRGEYNTFNCIRKGGPLCQALTGDSRFHSIFGAVAGCIAVNPSDTAPALITLNAKIVTSKQTVDAENFFAADLEKTTILDDDEIVTEIQVPTPAAGTKSAFIKFANRKAIDFAIVNCAAAISDSSARICLNGVYNLPRVMDLPIPLPSPDDIAEDAVADVDVANTNNGYKVQLAKVMVKRAVLACM